MIKQFSFARKEQASFAKLRHMKKINIQEIQ